MRLAVLVLTLSGKIKKLGFDLTPSPAVLRKIDRHHCPFRPQSADVSSMLPKRELPSFVAMAYSPQAPPRPYLQGSAPASIAPR